MRKIQQTFIVTIFVLLVVCSSAIMTNAQTSVSYTFLEVTDSAGKPVKGAKVESLGFGCSSTLITNQKGQLERGFPICNGDYHTSGIRVTKSGYLPFEDSEPFGKSRNLQNEFRIKLLKIPKTKQKKKVIKSNKNKQLLSKEGRDNRKQPNFTKRRESNNLCVKFLLS